MKIKIYLGCILGLILVTCIFVYSDIGLVFNALKKAGLSSIIFISLVHIASVILCGFAWRIVFISSEKGLLHIFLWARYLRDSIGNILGIIPATGEIAASRELTFHRIKPSIAAATLVVDITAELIGQVIFTFLGLIILLNIKPESKILYFFQIGLIVATLVLLLFLMAQKSGLLEFIERIPEKFDFKRSWNSFPNNETLYPQIERIYNDIWRLPSSTTLHFLGWLFSAGEIWLALYFLNSPIPFLDAIALQSLVFAIRTSAFFLPWGAGVQDGGYILIGSILGIEPHIAIALSLMKRTREIFTGLPGVLAWQYVESRRMWKKG